MAGESMRMGNWATPPQGQMPMCKICKRQGCSHFRRGFAHLLALNPVRKLSRLSGGLFDGLSQNNAYPTCADVKTGEDKSFETDIVIPSTCPCHGCSERVERVDVNRGSERSVTYLFDARKSSWEPQIARYRRHKIIESPKAGRYAQLWCRTCCNCESANKPRGKLLGCACAMHWHTVTNRSYHEKTPFHQLATTLIMTSYNEAVNSECKFEQVIGVIGMAIGWNEHIEAQHPHRQHYRFSQEQVHPSLLSDPKLLHAVDASQFYFTGMDQSLHPPPLLGPGIVSHMFASLPPHPPPPTSAEQVAVPQGAGRKREERPVEEDEREGKRLNQGKEGQKELLFSLSDLPDILTSGGKLSGGLTFLGSEF
ncbi:hypothetical protein GUITHDRAFT_146093 [Guillardia theta CCMP2712]|uniref:Uncharacterized protein n=1 Tax=Guillardia theta (strain CCMP2712) TaxID=905079 RepID=L1IIJ8_GUITC|nr:hypothetical protein GUITHDRAFT_146093 [Guillardia theta CCMP2712]EKX36056.1 hypothetical protein GUITHDRAFT_146093 [Guillardia theta CCMP2712]|eukprot:XP_005823036.1 hypothetical protein GUITHDRAFT_146093 [Guillardia theta CCMP2712]